MAAAFTLIFQTPVLIGDRWWATWMPHAFSIQRIVDDEDDGDSDEEDNDDDVGTTRSTTTMTTMTRMGALETLGKCLDTKPSINILTSNDLEYFKNSEFQMLEWPALKGFSAIFLMGFVYFTFVPFHSLSLTSQVFFTYSHSMKFLSFRGVLNVPLRRVIFLSFHFVRFIPAALWGRFISLCFISFN